MVTTIFMMPINGYCRSMFALLAIFTFIIILFLASIKAIELVFTTKRKIKPNYMKSIFTAFSLLIWFSFSTISTISVSTFLLQLPQIWFGNTQRANADAIIEQQDCQKIVDTIYSLENQIHQTENHRYLEEVSPIFTIKLEYQKGAEKINSVAEQYLALDIAESSRNYTKQIAEKLQQKAQLFQTRTEITENSKGIKEIVNLLEKMDRVTAERQNMIEGVERQCQKARE